MAKSTHAGLPWLLWLREATKRKARVHFWPFDGFDVPAGRPVIAEVYPSLFRRRYPNTGRSPDEHDAWCVTAWLRETDRRNLLDHYFHPRSSSSSKNKPHSKAGFSGSVKPEDRAFQTKVKKKQISPRPPF